MTNFANIVFVQKFGSYISLILLAIVIAVIVFISQSKQLAVYSQAETDCMCGVSAYFDESSSLCINGNIFCDNTSDPVCGCDSKGYLNSCVAHANGVKSFTKDSCSFMASLSCSSNEQCPPGKCTNGNNFKKFTCDLGLCTLIRYSKEPCSSSLNTNCLCSSGSYFDGSSCVKGTLNCSNLPTDSVCGCDNNTYLNSCAARSTGIKSFTKGNCNSSIILSCSNDDQCPLGKCPDNKSYNFFSCISNKCNHITFTSDPCSSVDCQCSTGEFFDGKSCVFGKLNCLSSISDPVCGCNGNTYSNSCTARANGIKSFTKGDCNLETSVLNCNADSDCPLGICKNGSTYKRFSCSSNSQCEEITYTTNPCSSGGLNTSSSSSSSGAIPKIDKHFTGFWQSSIVKCSPRLTTLASSSSSGTCISCPQVSINCLKGSILVPQSCNTCPYCENCTGVKITFQLCPENGQLKGIINHNRYLDRAFIQTNKVATSKKILASTSSKQLGTDVEIKLKLIDEKNLIANFDNGLYIEKFRAKKIQSKGCPIVERTSDCCDGFIAPSSAKQCIKNFSLSECLVPNLNSKVCCPISSSCAVPCGSMCCQLNEDCVLFDPCSNKNSFCFANPFLTCLDCNPKASCSLNQSSCPTGTLCSGTPDFLCYITGCPQLKK